MAFRKGIGKVQEVAERSGFSGNRRYFKWDPGEEKTIRFLTDGDDIVLTALHEFVPCADNTKRSFVCRKEVGEECELCANPEVKRREVAYAAAIWREASKDANDKVVFKTKTEEVEEEVDGKKVKKTVPWVGVIQQAPKNFWSWFWSAYDREGTLLARDYTVKRVGASMETTYQPYPEDKQELDLSKFKDYMPDIEGMLTFLGSKEYYDAKLHGIVSEKKDENGSSTGTITDEDLENLRKLNEQVAETASSGEFD